MKTIVDVLVYLSVRGLFAVLGVLPQWVRVALFANLFRLALLVMPKLKRTCLQNLELAFPERDVGWRREILRKNMIEMGRLLADTVRLATIDLAWIQAHMNFHQIESCTGRLKALGGPGALIITGHLGSFELLGHTCGLIDYPIAPVARKFGSPLLDKWWTGMREISGNRIIDRKGGYKAMLAAVLQGTPVAVLFDQNVTSKHAVFVDWFGTQAATTKAIALIAIKTRAPIFVTSLRYVGGDRYEVDALDCDCTDIYEDSQASYEEKVRILTQRISDLYCQLIVKFPEGWFWLHRRWKTRPEGDKRAIYS